VQLVLDHQVGRVEPMAARFRKPVQRLPPPGLCRAVEARLVRPVDMAEEGAGLSLPRKRRELVHGGDQEGRQAVIDGLVHRHDRQRPVAGEGAGQIGAAKLQIDGPVGVGDAAETLGREAGAAPGTGLDRGGGALVAARLIGAHALDRGIGPLVAASAQPVGAGVRLNPQPDLDRPVAQHRPSVGPPIVRSVAQQLQRADQTRRPAELVQRQQAERVAHHHRHARPEQPGRTQPPERDREGGQAQIRLGLAAAGREEEQVGHVAVGMRAVRHGGQVEEQEGELEETPAGYGIARPTRAGGVRHGAVRDLERGTCAIVPDEQRDAAGDAVAGDALHLDQRGGRPRALRRIGDAGLGCGTVRLFADPAGIGVRQWCQRLAQSLSAITRQGRQPVHPELGVRHVRGDGPLHGGARQVRGADAPNDAIGIRPMDRRATQPGRIGGGIAVMEVGKLVVPVVPAQAR